jgi:biopolymer transport protein ExbD
MARKVRKKNNVEEAEVPLSSMIDVVFLLLIYFIVTQKPIIEDTLLGVNLPSPSKPKTQEKPPDPMRIGVYKVSDPETAVTEKLYYINEKGPYPLDYLQQFLKTVGQNKPDTTIMITCGPNATHRKLIRVLDACGAANLTNLNILNDESVRFNPNPYSTARY